MSMKVNLEYCNLYDLSSCKWRFLSNVRWPDFLALLWDPSSQRLWVDKVYIWWSMNRQLGFADAGLSVSALRADIYRSGPPSLVSQFPTWYQCWAKAGFDGSWRKHRPRWASHLYILQVVVSNIRADITRYWAKVFQQFTPAMWQLVLCYLMNTMARHTLVLASERRTAVITEIGKIQKYPTLWQEGVMKKELRTS